MFVVLISSGIKTDDVNAAFFNGVNLTVNEADIADLGNLIRKRKTVFSKSTISTTG